MAISAEITTDMLMFMSTITLRVAPKQAIYRWDKILMSENQTRLLCIKENPHPRHCLPVCRVRARQWLSPSQRQADLQPTDHAGQTECRGGRWQRNLLALTTHSYLLTLAGAYILDQSQVRIAEQTYPEQTKWQQTRRFLPWVLG